MEEAITTGSLTRKLLKTRSLSRFMRTYSSNIRCDPVNLCLYKLCNDKGINAAQAIERSGIERTFGHQIFNGRRKPSRDKLLQLSFGIGLSFEETQNLLKVARKSALYARIERDIVIIYAINNGLSLAEVQEILNEFKLPVLGECHD